MAHDGESYFSENFNNLESNFYFVHISTISYMYAESTKRTTSPCYLGKFNINQFFHEFFGLVTSRQLHKMERQIQSLTASTPSYQNMNHYR